MKPSIGTVVPIRKLLHAAIWNSCAELFKSKQMPFPRATCSITAGSNTRWQVTQAAVVFAQKLEWSWRICYDYRGLNAIILPAVEVLSDIDTLLDCTQGSHSFISRLASQREEGIIFYHHLCSWGYQLRFPRTIFQEVTWAQISHLLAQSHSRNFNKSFDTYRACILTLSNCGQLWESCWT